MVLRTVNAVCGKRKSGKTIIIGDTTNLTVDINWFRKKYRRKDLKDKDYKRTYSRSKGYYIGMKLVLAIWWGLNCSQCQQLLFSQGEVSSTLQHRVS